MPRTEWGWRIEPAELRSWLLQEDGDLLVMNKPAHVPCHRAKHGPWSSLVSACRRVFAVDRLHMPSQLDRETSGVVVLAKSDGMRAALDRAGKARKIRKVYHAILCGDLDAVVTVDQPIGMAEGSRIAVRRAVRTGGQPSLTEFAPLRRSGNYTLVRVVPHTGRTHQIRVHASWLGHPVAGDKIYGPDEQLFLDFLREGWTPRHQELLRADRQALHASEWECLDPPLRFVAALPADWPALL